MPNKTYRMLWEFWGKIISEQSDKQSLCGRCNLLVLSPGGILDGKMGNTIWENGWCISFDSLRSRHQDRSRRSKDLLELPVKDKGEDLRRQGEASDPDRNACLTPVEGEERKEGWGGGLRLQHSSEKVLAGQRGVPHAKATLQSHLRPAGMGRISTHSCLLSN